MRAVASLRPDPATNNISPKQYMLKSNGGSGTVSNIVLENFIGHSNAYSLDIEQYWKSMKTLPGDGVQISNLKINNWTGTALDGKQRGPLQIKCADGAPCTGVDVTDFNMWTEKGDSQTYICQSAYTDLERAEPVYCMNGGTGTGYPVTTRTVTAAPTGYEAPRLGDNLEADFGFTVSIPVPAMPTSFFPNEAPIKPLAGGS
jgi:rhamnogalacturonan hydrolase